jgi:hypothetical protein
MRIVFLVCAFAAAVALGAETNLTLTVDGVTYNGVRFGRATPATVTVFHSTGVAMIPLAKLPPELQKQFGYDPQQAATWQAAQQKAEAEAAESQRRAAAEAADAQRKAAATVGWTLTVERVVPDGVMARGYKTGGAGDQATICLVDDPRVGELAEGNKFTTHAYKEGVITVEGRTLEKWVYYEPPPRTPIQPPTAPAVVQPATPQAALQVVAMSLAELRGEGAFGFPQREATVLWNQPALRFSVWNNAQYLFAQAVLWTDGDASVITNENGYELRDSSEVRLGLGADKKLTPKVDRDYMLNASAVWKGLYYQVPLGGGSTTGIRTDTQARGAIRYVEVSRGKRVRVDTYLIPLAELSKQVGDRIRLCYWGHSPKPPMTVSSIGEESTRLLYFNDDYGVAKYSEYMLRSGHEIDTARVPDGRADATPLEH